MPDKQADRIIQIMLVVLLGAVLLPVAFSNWFGANQTGWGSGTSALWPIIPIIALIGVLYILYKKYV